MAADDPARYATRSTAAAPLMGVLANLARMITPRQKANPAGEGNWHPGPYTVGAGCPASEWGQCEFLAMRY